MGGSVCDIHASTHVKQILYSTNFEKLNNREVMASEFRKLVCAMGQFFKCLFVPCITIGPIALLKNARAHEWISQLGNLILFLLSREYCFARDINSTELRVTYILSSVIHGSHDWNQKFWTSHVPLPGNVPFSYCFSTKNNNETHACCSGVRARGQKWHIINKLSQP